jgi:hypothetical protein
VRSVIAAGRVAGDVFNGHDTHRLASMPTHRLIASSEGLGWRNLYAVVQREAPFDSYLDAVDDHLFVFHLTGSAGIHWSMSERTVDGRVTPGCYDYFPGGRGVGVQLRGSIETMHLYLRSRVVDAAIAEMQVGGERVTLEPVFNGRDPFIIQMAIALRSALNERSTANQIYAENLSWALAAHLVRSSNHAHSTDLPISTPISTVPSTSTSYRLPPVSTRCISAANSSGPQIPLRINSSSDAAWNARSGCSNRPVSPSRRWPPPADFATKSI